MPLSSRHGGGTLAEAFLRIGVDDAKMTAGLKKTQASMMGLQTAMKAVGAVAAVVFASKVVQAIGTAMSKFAEFEQSMLTVKAIMGQNLDTSQFRDLGNLAKELGATTAFRASDAADALVVLSRAGNTANESMQLLPQTLNLAASGMLSLEQSADIVSKVMKGMQLPAGKAREVVDTLAAAANSANTDIAELGEVFAKVGPVGAQQGRSLKELAAAAQVLANAGRRGAEAGTALNRVFTRLYTPTGAAAAEMKRLNIVTQDARGNLLPLADVIRQIENRFQGMTQAQQAMFGNLVAGQYGMVAFNALIAAGADELEKAEAALGNVDGTAKRMADTQMEGLGGAMKEFNSSLEAVGLTLGEVFGPALAEMIRHLSFLLRLIPKTKQGLDTIAEAYTFMMGSSDLRQQMIQGVIGKAFGAANDALTRERGFGLAGNPVPKAPTTGAAAKPVPVTIDKIQQEALDHFTRRQTETFKQQRIAMNREELRRGEFSAWQQGGALRRLSQEIANEQAKKPLMITSAEGFSSNLISHMGGSNQSLLAVLQQEKQIAQEQLNETKKSNENLRELIEKDVDAKFGESGIPEG